MFRPGDRMFPECSLNVSSGGGAQVVTSSSPSTVTTAGGGVVQLAHHAKARDADTTKNNNGALNQLLLLHPRDRSTATTTAPPVVQQAPVVIDSSPGIVAAMDDGGDSPAAATIVIKNEIRPCSLVDNSDLAELVGELDWPTGGGADDDDEEAGSGSGLLRFLPDYAAWTGIPGGGDGVPWELFVLPPPPTSSAGPPSSSSPKARGEPWRDGDPRDSEPSHHAALHPTPQRVEDWAGQGALAREPWQDGDPRGDDYYGCRRPPRPSSSPRLIGKRRAVMRSTRSGRVFSPYILGNTAREDPAAAGYPDPAAAGYPELSSGSWSEVGTPV
eukprot:567826-Prorocentrum_minimum.AAC.4